MPTLNPKVSIGLPVRNGERYVSNALESLLAQTFTDFEVIICDNASSDKTGDIARDFLARDPRVRYHRNPRDIGPAGNFNMSFELSKGEYFKWAAHDDVLAPQYLEKCVEALDRDASAVLAFPGTQIIDDQGRPLDTYEFRLATDSTEVATRFAELVLVNHRQHRAVEIFGLMRSSALRRTPLQGSYARADSVLLARLALLGRFVEVPDRLFLSRSHATQSMQTRPVEARNGRSVLVRYLGTGPLPPPEWWDSSRKGRVNFPEWRLVREYWASIGAAPISFADRCRCHLVMLQWFVFNAHKLGRDVAFAVEHVVNRAVGSDPLDSEAHAT